MDGRSYKEAKIDLGVSTMGVQIIGDPRLFRKYFFYQQNDKIYLT